MSYIQLENHSVQVFDLTPPVNEEDEEVGMICLDRLIIGFVALAAIGAVVFGSLTLYATLSHTSIGLLHPKLISIPGSAVIMGGGCGTFLLSVAILGYMRHRQKKRVDELYQKITPETASDQIESMTFLGRYYVATYANEVGERTYYIVIKQVNHGLYFNLFIFADSESHDRALARLQQI